MHLSEMFSSIQTKTGHDERHYITHTDTDSVLTVDASWNQRME